MSKRWSSMLFAALLLAACGREKGVQTTSQYESAEPQARAFNFEVYPGAQFMQAQTDLLRKAHFVLNPGAKEAPPMALYDTDAPLQQVAKFYAEKYGYPPVVSVEDAAFSTVKPKAYYTSGDLGADAAEMKPVLEKMNMSTDTSAAKGRFDGAYVAPQVNLPRVTLQRPYFDLLDRKVVDRTLIVMVKE